MLLVGGLALTFTVIGACIGIPMMIVGVPAMIWGAVLTFQGQAQRAQEAIAAGVQSGMYHAAPPRGGGVTSGIPQTSLPPPLPPPTRTETAESRDASQPGELSTDEGSRSKDPPQ